MMPIIASFVLAPMDAEAPDVEHVLRDFRHCLNTFDEWAESFWSASVLNVEQVFKVGDDIALVAPIASKTPSSTVTTCKAQGSLTLVHMFESTRFVPIGNTPVLVQAIAADGRPIGAPIRENISPSGILELKDCTCDQRYQITFYPDVSKDHVKALYASYQSVISSLEVRLREEWAKTFKVQWDDFSTATPFERSLQQGRGFATGMANALHNLWDNITQLYDLLDLKTNSEKLLSYLSQADLDALLKLGSDADGTDVKYHYDNVRLLLTEIENEVGETYQLDYHANGLIQQEIGFDGQRTAYVYDLNGNLQEKTEHGDDGRQLVTRYERDHAGRLVRKTLPDASIVDYAYDRQGNLLSIDDGHWALAYEYDSQNRLIAEHQGWGTLRYGYDACGQLKNLRLPDNNRVVFNHDKGGDLATVELNGSPLTSHLFKNGRERQRQQGQLLSHYHYDDQHRLHAHVVTQQEETLYQRHYAYGKTGNLSQIIDSRKGDHHYHYDPLARLTRADHS